MFREISKKLNSSLIEEYKWFCTKYSCTHQGKSSLNCEDKHVCNLVKTQ